MAAFVHSYAGVGGGHQPGVLGLAVLLTGSVQDGQAFGFEAAIWVRVLVLKLSDLQGLRQVASRLVVVRRSHGAAGDAASGLLAVLSLDLEPHGDSGAATGLGAGAQTLPCDQHWGGLYPFGYEHILFHISVTGSCAHSTSGPKYLDKLPNNDSDILTEHTKSSLFSTNHLRILIMKPFVSINILLFFNT